MSMYVVPPDNRIECEIDAIAAYNKSIKQAARVQLAAGDMSTFKTNAEAQVRDGSSVASPTVAKLGKKKKLKRLRFKPITVIRGIGPSATVVTAKDHAKDDAKFSERVEKYTWKGMSLADATVKAYEKGTRDREIRILASERVSERIAARPAQVHGGPVKSPDGKSYEIMLSEETVRAITERAAAKGAR